MYFSYLETLRIVYNLTRKIFCLLKNRPHQIVAVLVAYLSCHQTASDANCSMIGTQFISITMIFVFEEMYTYLIVFSDPMFLWISSLVL